MPQTSTTRLTPSSPGFISSTDGRNFRTRKTPRRSQSDSLFCQWRQEAENNPNALQRPPFLTLVDDARGGSEKQNFLGKVKKQPPLHCKNSFPDRMELFPDRRMRFRRSKYSNCQSLHFYRKESSTSPPVPDSGCVVPSDSSCKSAEKRDSDSCWIQIRTPPQYPPLSSGF